LVQPDLCPIQNGLPCTSSVLGLGEKHGLVLTATGASQAGHVNSPLFKLVHQIRTCCSQVSVNIASMILMTSIYMASALKL